MHCTFQSLIEMRKIHAVRLDITGQPTSLSNWSSSPSSPYTAVDWGLATTPVNRRVWLLLMRHKLILLWRPKHKFQDHCSGDVNTYIFDN